MYSPDSNYPAKNQRTEHPSASLPLVALDEIGAVPVVVLDEIGSVLLVSVLRFD